MSDDKITGIASRTAGHGQRLSQPRLNCTNCTKSGMVKAADNTLQLVCRAELPKVASAFIPMAQGPQLVQATIWPLVQDTDWCAHHQPQLNA